jgi:rod shape determining protein RodA
LIGDIRNGSQRWIDLGFFDLQPSELGKLAVIVALARYCHDHELPQGYGLKDLVRPAALVGFPFLLILEQPDLGTGLVVVFIAVTMLAVERVRAGALAALAAGTLAAIPLMWHFVMHDYQKARVIAFIWPEDHLQGDAWQVSQSITAIGSGQMWGKGFLQGTQVQNGFVTFHETDFIFAHHAEQFGFAGSIALLVLYLALALWGLHVARYARDRFATLCAVGVSAFVFWHVIINIGMVAGALPVVGLWLPLVSYGGTATVTIMAAMGLLTSISLRRHVF